MSTEDDFSTEPPSDFVANPKLFKPKSPSKVIRVLTVLAYVLSVSMAAILLSIYYIFMWDGQRLIVDGTIEAYTDDNNNSINVKMMKLVSINETINVTEINLTTPSIIISSISPSDEEMQKQITALQEDRLETEELLATETTRNEENITWPDYNFSSEFDSKSNFIKKLMYNKDPYDEND